jgi:hypothetical protein
LNKISNLKVPPNEIRMVRTVPAEYHGPDMNGLEIVTNPLTPDATLVGE